MGYSGEYGVVHIKIIVYFAKKLRLVQSTLTRYTIGLIYVSNAYLYSKFDVEQAIMQQVHGTTKT